MDISHEKGSDLIIRIPVTFDPGSIITTLTGGTAIARATDGYIIVEGDCSINQDGNEVLVSFNDNEFVKGLFRCVVEVTVGTVTQPVASFTILVN